jgi:choline dehydrogenase
MHSGIGERLHLEARGIACIHSLNGVGKNLQDHLFYAISGLANSQEGQNHHLKPLNQVKGLWNYLFFKKGIFTSGPLESVLFGNSGITNDYSVDFQFHFASLQIGEDYSADVYNLNTFPKEDGFSILPTLLKPKSRGEITLSKDKSNHGLEINPNFCTNDYDRQVLIKTGKLAFDIINSSTFKPHLKRMMQPKSNDDEVMWQHIQKQVETVYHPVGTCKMGHDVDAVVDNNLLVHGIGKLMIADASIMPEIISGNTNAVAIMIGEKASSLLMS